MATLRRGRLAAKISLGLDKSAETAGGWRSRRERGAPNPTYVPKSKKGYTGTGAGFGRTNGPHPIVIRRGPGGPSRFPPAVQLPNRPPLGKGGYEVEYRPAAAPSLMTRIGRRLRRQFGRTGS